MLEKRLEKISDDGLTKHAWLVFFDDSYCTTLNVRVGYISKYCRRTKKCKWVEKTISCVKPPVPDVMLVMCAAEMICKEIMDAASAYAQEKAT